MVKEGGNKSHSWWNMGYMTHKICKTWRSGHYWKSSVGICAWFWIFFTFYKLCQNLSRSCLYIGPLQPKITSTQLDLCCGLFFILTCIENSKPTFTTFPKSSQFYFFSNSSNSWWKMKVCGTFSDIKHITDSNLFAQYFEGYLISQPICINFCFS